jgi:ribonuclease-3
MTDALAGLQERLGYRFQRQDLLAQALTHRSFSAGNYERLEFLGDGVLNCVIGLLLYERFPALKEGPLSRLRANLVNQQPLYEIAREIDLGHHLRLGEGELKSGGAERPSILADALESILGAALLDGGFEVAKGIVARLFGPRLQAVDPETHGKDAKTQLQEWLQSRHHALPDYALVAASGQAHAQTFRVECRITALGLVTQGSGSSRKAAEQAAAQAAFGRLAKA